MLIANGHGNSLQASPQKHHKHSKHKSKRGHRKKSHKENSPIHQDTHQYAKNILENGYNHFTPIFNGKGSHKQLSNGVNHRSKPSSNGTLRVNSYGKQQPVQQIKVVICFCPFCFHNLIKSIFRWKCER